MSTLQLLLVALLISGLAGIALGFVFHILEYYRDERKLMAREKRDAKMLRRTGHV